MKPFHFHVRAPWATLSLVLLTSASAGCSKENNISATNNNFEGLQTAVINADGGRLEGTDGLSVEVAPGSIAERVTIAGGAVDAVKAPPLPTEVTPLGLFYTLQPHGQKFGKQVSINIPFKTTGPSMKLYTADPGGAWTAIAGAAPQGTTMRAQVDHFSFFVVVSEDPCTRGGKSAPDGTACGTGKVCKAGQCLVCEGGGACPLGEGQCTEGVLSCATGVPVCVASSEKRADGSDCGDGKVCSAGVCRSCENGAACTQASFPCKQAAFTCESGKAVCEASADDREDGTKCGTARSCFGGECIDCDAGAACEGSNPCKKSIIDCGTGQPICEETAADASNGSSCGAGLVCHDGVCGACEQGIACDLPEAPCKKAATSCATGVSLCKATTANVEDGVACGAGKICGGGACIACDEGASCVPVAAPCHAGKTSCASGAPVCVDTGTNAAGGTACGSGQTCDGAGACVKTDSVLTVVSGDKQSAMINQALPAPLVLKLSGPGGAAVAGKKIAAGASPGATILPTEVTTDSQGRAVFQIRNGRQIGPHTFTATVAGAPLVPVTSTATEPPVGTVVPIVNAMFSSSDPDLSRAAVASGAGSIGGFAVGKDGTVYVATAGATGAVRQIVRVAPDGSWSKVIDTPAMIVVGMALDAAEENLYLAIGDAGLSVVRLGAKALDFLGGTGTAPGPGYGDGQPLPLAKVGIDPYKYDPLAMDSGGALWVACAASRAFRRYHPDTTVIDRWLSPGAPVLGVPGSVYSNLGVSNGEGHVAPLTAPDGSVWFTAIVAPSGGNSSSRLVRRKSGSDTLYGHASTSGSFPPVDGPINDSRLDGIRSLRSDGAGLVYATTGFGAYRIDAGSEEIFRVLGGQPTATATTGSFAPGRDASSWGTDGVAIDGARNLYVHELGGACSCTGEASIRVVWKAAEMK